MYWKIGEMINKYKIKNNSKHGDNVITIFSEELYSKHGKGFNKRNIERMCLFNKVFNFATPGSQTNDNFIAWRNFENVHWSHIRELLKFNNLEIIMYYLNEVENKKLSKTELLYLLKSKSYERTIAHQNDKPIKHEIEKTLKDPVILEIEDKKRTEKELEQDIFDNVLNFKKEIGNQIMLYDRQYKININGLIHRVDFVFHDYETDTFILIDLKVKKITNRDISQMKLYIKHFSKELKKNNVKVIGLILCETKDMRIEVSDEIYQIKYLNEIPKEEELLKIINDNKVILLKTEELKLDK